MSVRIGEVYLHPIPACEAAIHVYASSGGVEIHSEATITLDPVQARNHAALLVRAADEVERMRARGEPELP